MILLVYRKQNNEDQSSTYIYLYLKNVLASSSFIVITIIIIFTIISWYHYSTDTSIFHAVSRYTATLYYLTKTTCRPSLNQKGKGKFKIFLYEISFFRAMLWICGGFDNKSRLYQNVQWTVLASNMKLLWSIRSGPLALIKSDRSDCTICTKGLFKKNIVDFNRYTFSLADYIYNQTK